MTQHVHAENMRLYAEDALETDKPWERWETFMRGLGWEKLITNPAWSPETEYRRIDPHRELKEIAKDPTKQIRVNGDVWQDVGAGWDWSEPPEKYEVRDKPAEKKLVKYLCYEDVGGGLYWINEDKPIITTSKRIPELDKAVIAKLKAALDCAFAANEHGEKLINQALAIPNDDSALQEMLKQAKREAIDEYQSRFVPEARK